KSKAPLVLAILGGLVVAGGIIAAVAVVVSKHNRIDTNTRSGDDLFAKGDFEKALASYKLVLEDDKDNAAAIKRKGECEQKLDELAVETEGKGRIAKARAATPEDAVKALTETAINDKLTDDQKTRVLARVDVLLAIA